MIAALRRIPVTERRAAILSIVTGVVLLGLKFFAYWVTGSSAVFSDAMESIVNVMASFVAVWALVIAHSPPDDEHPYGHGKIEFVSAGFEGGMILLAAVFIFISTLDAFLSGKVAPKELGTGLVVLGLATVLNGVVGVYLVRTGRTQKSITLEADGKHLLADALTSVAVLATLGFVKFTGWQWADPIMAIGIAVYIAVMGLRLLNASAAGLMDKQDVADEKLLRAILDAHAKPDGLIPTICGYHKLRHRHSGRFHWVDFHIVVPSRLDVAAGHATASAIEYEIERTLGEGNATAHVEPCPGETCEACARHALA